MALSPTDLDLTPGRRDRILEAAQQLWAQHSYREVSLRQIAETADCTSTLIAHHFGTKEELYLAVMQAWRGLFEEATTRQQALGQAAGAANLAQWVDGLMWPLQRLQQQPRGRQMLRMTHYHRLDPTPLVQFALAEVHRPFALACVDALMRLCPGLLRRRAVQAHLLAVNTLLDSAVAQEALHRLVPEEAPTDSAHAATLSPTELRSYLLHSVAAFLGDATDVTPAPTRPVPMACQGVPPDPQAHIAALQQAARQHSTAFPGGALHWHCWGHGPPLVLLHGGHGSWMHWLRNVAALSATHQVWVPDLPGFGTSDELPGGPGNPQRLTHMGQALVMGLASLLGPARDIDLLGFSFGALVAAELVQQGVPVRRMALIGAAGHRSPRRPIEPLQDWRVPDPAARRAALRQNLATFMFSQAARVDELAYTAHAWSCERTRFRSKALSIGGDLQAQLLSYRDPLLLLWGEHDVTATPAEAAPRLAAAGPQRQWQVVPDAGHWLQYEQAAWVNQRLRDWFNPSTG